MLVGLKILGMWSFILIVMGVTNMSNLWVSCKECDSRICCGPGTGPKGCFNLQGVRRNLKAVGVDATVTEVGGSVCIEVERS
jgi:hypothetical protein